MKRCKYLVDEKSGSMKIPRPHFSWLIYVRGILLLAVDAAVLVGVLFVLRMCASWFVLGNSSLDISMFKGNDWVGIVKYSVWPLSVFVLVILFRNPLLQILYEIPGFVRRSWCRVGGYITKPGSDDRNIGAEDVRCGDQDEQLELKQQKDAAAAEPIRKGATDDPALFEQRVLIQLEKEYGVPVFRDMGIENSRFYFDGVIETENRLFGIEVKKRADLRTWQKIFDRMGVIYSGFSFECKRRFSLMVCVGEDASKEDREKLSIDVEKRPFRTVIRYFKTNG